MSCPRRGNHPRVIGGLLHFLRYCAMLGALSKLNRLLRYSNLQCQAGETLFLTSSLLRGAAHQPIAHQPNYCRIVPSRENGIWPWYAHPVCLRIRCLLLLRAIRALWGGCCEAMSRSPGFGRAFLPCRVQTIGVALSSGPQIAIPLRLDIIRPKRRSHAHATLAQPRRALRAPRLPSQRLLRHTRGGVGT